ncbi:MAG: hypothetical protein ABI232_11965 [Jatrophihabitantaceae bacterium]
MTSTEAAHGPILGVVGGCGGVGASSFAAALASGAGGTLVDLDPVGGGTDVLLGIEDVQGARWSGLQLDGGYLEPTLLADGLPRWGPVPVLACDGVAPSCGEIGQVLGAAVANGPVVLDLPRGPTPERDEAVRWCSLVVIVARAELRAVAAAQVLLRSLPDVPVGLVVRRGEIGVDTVASYVGAPMLGVLPPLVGSPDYGRVPRQVARVVAGILDGLRGLTELDGPAR